MNEYNYIPEIEDEDDDKEKVPEVKQNEVSQKFAIGVSLGVMIWILLFMVLKSAGIISPLVMRICIYPVIIAVIIIYAIIKNKNNTIK